VARQRISSQPTSLSFRSPFSLPVSISFVSDDKVNVIVKKDAFPTGSRNNPQGEERQSNTNIPEIKNKCKH
jgi:hypothetical protein